MGWAWEWRFNDGAETRMFIVIFNAAGQVASTAIEEDPRRTGGRCYVRESRGHPAQVFLRCTAVTMPRRISSGRGGQPGTATSTGMMLATLPQLA
jgi:hypothetical protein